MSFTISKARPHQGQKPPAPKRQRTDDPDDVNPFAFHDDNPFANDDIDNVGDNDTDDPFANGGIDKNDLLENKSPKRDPHPEEYRTDDEDDRKSNQSEKYAKSPMKTEPIHCKTDEDNSPSKNKSPKNTDNTNFVPFSNDASPNGNGVSPVKNHSKTAKPTPNYNKFAHTLNAVVDPEVQKVIDKMYKKPNRAPPPPATKKPVGAASQSLSNGQASNAHPNASFQKAEPEVDPTLGRRVAGSKSNVPDTHVVFAIDMSGSMREVDAYNTEGKKCSRWDAVFHCAQEFIDDQVKALKSEVQSNHAMRMRMQQSNMMSMAQMQAQGAMDKLNSVQSKTYISLVLWSDAATLIFNRQELSPLDSGASVKEALKIAMAEIPRGGTCFASAFRECNDLLVGENNITEPDVVEKTVVLFLSDGRPGDLAMEPPKDEYGAIQQTYKAHGQTRHSAAVEIERFRSNAIELFCGRIESCERNRANMVVSENPADVLQTRC